MGFQAIRIGLVLVLWSLQWGVQALAGEVGTQLPTEQRAQHQKNPALAAALGGVLGFGAGHAYVHGEWTMRSTTFVPLDVIATPMLALGVTRLTESNPWGVIALTIGVPFRFYEGWSAYQEAERRNLGYSRADNPSPLKERQADTAIVFGGLIGFGLGHLYVQRRWTWRATLFAILDGLAVGYLVHSIRNGDNFGRIHPSIVSYELIRGAELFDALILARKENERLASASPQATVEQNQLKLTIPLISMRF